MAARKITTGSKSEAYIALEVVWSTDNTPIDTRASAGGNGEPAAGMRSGKSSTRIVGQMSACKARTTPSCVLEEPSRKRSKS